MKYKTTKEKKECKQESPQHFQSRPVKCPATTRDGLSMNNEGTRTEGSTARMLSRVPKRQRRKIKNEQEARTRVSSALPVTCLTTGQRPPSKTRKGYAQECPRLDITCAQQQYQNRPLNRTVTHLRVLAMSFPVPNGKTATGASSRILPSALTLSRSCEGLKESSSDFKHFHTPIACVQLRPSNRGGTVIQA